MTLESKLSIVPREYATKSELSFYSKSMIEVIPREAREYELGKAKYYLVVAFSAIIWQFFFLGAIGVIFYGSSLLAAVIIATLLPVTEILAVFFFQESFRAEKGISLALSLWGFASYFYGEFKASKKKGNPRLHTPPSQVQEIHPFYKAAS